MKKSGYLQRMQSQREREFLNTQRFTRQLMCDLAMIALNNAFGFGPVRLQRFADELVEVFSEYADIWNGDTQDTTYARACLDRKLREILGDNAQPWEVRYS